MQNRGPNDCFGNVRALERREFCKRWGRRLASCIVAALLVGGGYRIYGNWHERHLTQQAQALFSQRDYDNATLIARRVLQFDSKNVVACRILAEIAESSGQPETLFLREKVVALEPDVAANRIALASAAFRFGQIDFARKNLDAITAGDRTDVKYHQLSGAIALAEKNPALAEREYSAALRLDPGNPQFTLKLATARLALVESPAREESLATLANLAEQPALRMEALRALTSDALKNKLPLAAKWAAALRAEKEVSFDDVLLFLEAVAETDRAPQALHDAEAIASQSAGNVAALIAWMNRHMLAEPALAWAFTLPRKISDTPPVPLAIAESYSVLEDWNGLQRWIDGKNWGDDEFLRLALVSHVLFHLTPVDRASMESQTAWATAIKATKNQPQRLAAIAQLAEDWGYAEEAADTWWIIANGNEKAKEALTALQRLYRANQNSHGLLRVARRALELNPSDLIAANSCANLGLLLTGDSSARRLAQKLHAENPTNPMSSFIYAFALFTEGKLNAALQQMETLKEAQLRHPIIAAYYFVMLVENGKMEQAHAFLSAANKAQLLPEEQQLFSAATRKLLQHDSRSVMRTVAADN